jgi:hypothetical protein
MTYRTNSYFQSLLEKNESYEQLKEYLGCNDAGKLRCIESGEHDGRYAIFRYVKGFSDMVLPSTSLWRSVIWDKARNIPMCVAPVKANPNFPPFMKYDVVEDFVDGVMVNLFVDHSTGKTVIATRTSIGAKGSFYTNKSFHDMFLDAITHAGYNSLDDFGKLFCPEESDPSRLSTFASLVLQHPDHRIVARNTTPRVWLVSVGSVDACDTGIVVSTNDNSETWPAHLQKLKVARYNQRQFESADDLNEFLKKTAILHGWTWQGIVLKDSLGNRWRLRSSTYQHLRGLRGSESTAVDRFLRNRCEGTVKEYLRHYNEDRDPFWHFEQTLRARTRDVWDAYYRVHKVHTLAFSDLPSEYQMPVYRIHVMYLNAKKNNTPIKISVTDVITLVNQMLSYEQKRLLLAAPLTLPDVAADSLISSNPV